MQSARKRKEREFLVKIYDEISPPKARLRQPKALSKTKKPPPQNPHAEIPPANFSR